MFKIGDRVLYGVHGVCVIAALEQRIVDRKKVEYFALEPLGQSRSRYYVPTQNAAALSKLRPLLSRGELEALLASSAARRDCWIPDENRRRQSFRDLLNSGDRADLLSMVRCLYLHRDSQLAQGKKFHLTDENFLRDGCKVLESELALVLEMDSRQAHEYLRNQLCV